MDWLTFFSKIIENLAWPVVFLVFVTMFRTIIASLVPNISHLSIGNFKIDITKEIAEAKLAAIEVEKSTVTKLPIREVVSNEVNTRIVSLGLRPSPSGLDLNYYREIAQLDPGLALAGVRMELEIQADNLLKGFGISSNGKRGALQSYHLLHQKGKLTDSQLRLIRSVLSICNAAVHGQAIDYSQAEEVLSILEELRKYYIDWLDWGFKQPWAHQMP